MKRILATIFLSFAVFGLAYGQEEETIDSNTEAIAEEMPTFPVPRPKNEVNYSLSYATYAQAQCLAGGVLVSIIGALFGVTIPTVLIVPGSFGVEYNHYLNNVIGVGGGVSLDCIFSPIIGGGLYTTVLPDVKFRWLYRNKIRLYSKLGAGYTVGFPFYLSSDSESYHVDSRFAWQITPIGLEFNTRQDNWKMFFDLGLGTQGLISFGVRNTF